MSLLPLLLLAPLLLAVGYNDLRYMRIPNTLGLLAVALFVLTAPLVGLPEIGLRVAAALIVFLIGFIGFGLRLLGGGDVKILSALVLFIPSQTLALFSLGFSVSMILGILFVLTLRAAPWFSGSSWATLNAPGKFPMGISIALAGLMHPFLIQALL